MSKERATELEYLEWFRYNVDFGPAHEDVIEIMNEEFRRKTGKLLPKGWSEKIDDREEAVG